MRRRVTVPHCSDPHAATLLERGRGYEDGAIVLQIGMGGRREEEG